MRSGTDELVRYMSLLIRQLWSVPHTTDLYTSSVLQTRTAVIGVIGIKCVLRQCDGRASAGNNFMVKRAAGYNASGVNQIQSFKERGLNNV